MDLMYKEHQKGFGVVVSLSVSKTRILIGVFDNEEEIHKSITEDLIELHPFNIIKIVPWSKEEYSKYEYSLDIKKLIKRSKKYQRRKM